MQDRVHAAPEAVRDAVEPQRGSGDPAPAGRPVERNLGQSVPWLRLTKRFSYGGLRLEDLIGCLLLVLPHKAQRTFHAKRHIIR